MKIIATTFLLFFVLMLNTQAQNVAWNAAAIDIAASSYGNALPRVVSDGAGNPLALWGRMSDGALFFARWNSSMAMFDTPQQLNPAGTPIASASWMGPDLASRGDTVYVVMKEVPEDDTSSHILFTRSFDGGQSFSTPTRVDFIGDSLSRFCTVSIDDAGNPLVAFMKFDVNFLHSSWVVCRSNDFGDSFLPHVKASGWGNSAEVCDCCPGTLLSSGNDCVMLYRDNNANLRDMWMGVSNDGGDAFYDGCNIDNHGWVLGNCPSSGPDAVMLGDTVYSVFMSGGTGDFRVYLSKSSLSGVSNSSVELLHNAAIAGLTQQNYPRIARDGNAAAVVWKQAVSSVSQIPILYTDDIRNGFPAIYDTADLANSINADVALADGNIYVVWQDPSSATVKFRAGTPNLNNAIPTIQNNIFNVRAYPNPAAVAWSVQGLAPNGLSQIKLYNALGECVATPSAQQDGNAFYLNIDNQHLSAGLYWLYIASGAHSQTLLLVRGGF